MRNRLLCGGAVIVATMIVPVAALADGEAEPTKARVAYLAGGTKDVWPLYSAGRRAFVSADIGTSFLVGRPAGAVGAGTGFVGALRGGFAPGASGLEVFGDLGGNLLGPQSVFFDVGARWMFAPLSARGVRSHKINAFPLYIGPEASLGVFFRLPNRTFQGDNGAAYDVDAQAYPMLGLSADVVVALAPSFALEFKVPDLRIMPDGDASLVTMGFRVGATLRF